MNTCAVPGCDNAHRARGYCSTHYKRQQLYGDPLAPDRRPLNAGPCVVNGCDRKHYARGLCSAHYKRWRKGLAIDGPVIEANVVDTAARLEDLEWMAETGESLTGAAARIGLTTDGVTAFLKRNGRPDLASVLRSRDPATLEDPELAARRVANWHATMRRKRQEVA